MITKTQKVSRGTCLARNLLQNQTRLNKPQIFYHQTGGQNINKDTRFNPNNRLLMPEQKTSKQKTSKQKENHCSLKCSINKSSTNFGPERSRVRPNLESTMLASIDFDISTFCNLPWEFTCLKKNKKNPEQLGFFTMFLKQIVYKSVFLERSRVRTNFDSSMLASIDVDISTS